LLVGSTLNATGSEFASNDNPHLWFDSTGMLSSVSDTNILSASGNTATLDFSGIRWSWAGTDNIVINTPALGDNGIANIVCAFDCSGGDAYMLDFVGHIESASPSGLGGEEVRIHLEGRIAAVPVPAAVWFFCSGLLGLFGVARKRVRKS